MLLPAAAAAAAAAAVAAAAAAAACCRATSCRVRSVLPFRYLVHPGHPGPREQRGHAPFRSACPSSESCPFLITR